MKAIKSLGNNAVICLDSKGRELIALGPGLGFQKCPKEISDLSLIERTFYGIDENYQGLLSIIEPVIFEIAADVIDLAKMETDCDYSPNAAFTLADHINFSIQRMNKGILFSTPLSVEISSLYPVETKVAGYAIHLISKRMHIRLPKSEEYGIVLSLINSQETSNDRNRNIDAEEIIEDCIQIVESSMQVTISRESFNYSRFCSHMQYLLRKNEHSRYVSENSRIYDKLVEEYPKSYECANKIIDHLKTVTRIIYDEEDILYLILHINRLCSREIDQSF